MHELTITHSVLDIALRHAEEAGARRITALHLVLGELSSVVDDSFQFYWNIVSAGTIAVGADLHFRRVPADFLCRTCGHTYSLPDGLICPACGGVDVQLTAGDECYIEAIDIDVAVPAPAAGEIASRGLP